MRTCQISTPTIRLSDALKLAGLAGTGGQAKFMIQDGEVRVDGRIVTARGSKLGPGALIEVGGERVRILAE